MDACAPKERCLSCIVPEFGAHHFLGWLCTLQSRRTAVPELCPLILKSTSLWPFVQVRRGRGFRAVTHLSCQ